MKMRLVCFNVNGIRARLHQLEAVIAEHSPEIIGLQETKVNDPEFPIKAVNALGYKVDFYGQKGHYGVALLSRQSPISVQRGFPCDEIDSQRRIIHGTYQFGGTKLHVVNGYFPQGEGREHPTKFPAKARFYSDLLAYLKENFTIDDRLIVMGDVNVAATDSDVGLTAENAKRWLRTGKSSFLPEEREWLQKLTDWGLTDTYRDMHGVDSRVYSWYDYRSRGYDQDPKIGLRIDLILASEAVQCEVLATGIDVAARGHEKPSDHCPIWVDIELPDR
ncbi:MAG: exodeoxyribonuclease III [Porticoccaceae bacterium]|nr:exodeoxyribonuclease III [Porticoccaceae bacterium]